MNLVSSGKIASPVPHLTFALAGYSRLRLLLRGVAMDNPPDGLCALFSEDGSVFANSEGDYRYQRATFFDQVDAEVGSDSSMIVSAVSNSEPHFADIDIEPGEGDEQNNIWIMPFIRTLAVSHSSGGPVNEQAIARFANYNTRQTHMRLKGADGHDIISGEWWLYGLPTPA